MSYLRDTGYLLVKDDDIIAVVEAMNDRGWSAKSPDSATGILVMTEPND